MTFQPATALARGTVARGDHEKNICSCSFIVLCIHNPKISPLLGVRDNTFLPFCSSGKSIVHPLGSVRSGPYCVNSCQNPLKGWALGADTSSCYVSIYYILPQKLQASWPCA